MRRARWLLVALLPFGLLLVGVGVVVTWLKRRRLFAATDAGEPALERYRSLVADELMKQAPLTSSEVHARALMAIFSRETGLQPRPEGGYIGDASLAGGPSIGPGQVYRSTAKRLGLWSPATSDERAEYRALADNDARCVAMAVTVFLAKFRDDVRLDNVDQGQLSRGDLTEAIRLYNGPASPPPSKPGYTADVLAFAARKWGGLA